MSRFVRQLKLGTCAPDPELEHARGRRAPGFRILAVLLTLLLGSATVVTVTAAAPPTNEPRARNSASSLAGKVKQCDRKFSGKSRRQRRARQRCIAKAREAAKGGGHKDHGSPPGSPGSTPPSAPTLSPTPTPSPGPSPPPSPTVPDTAIDSAPSGPIAQRDVGISFHSDPSGASFQCSLNGAAWSACSSPAHYSSLADGSYEFAVRAVEGESVDPTPATASFKVETTPPQTTITSAPGGRIPTGAVSVDFSSNETDSTFECSLDGASYASCVSPYELPDLAPGPHNLEVRAVNGAGVVDPSPSSANWSSAEGRHDLCGAISHDTAIGPDYAGVYVITCEVEVPEGKTLVIEPGAIVKAEDGTSLSVHGTLNAIGTAAQPITFTSINDNSIGGTTGSGSPHAGDWRGIATLGEHGSIDLEHASLSYAQTAVQAYAYGEGSAVVKNNTFSSQSSGAAWINGAASPALQGNSSTDSGEGQPAFMVSSSSLDADLLGANSATGNGIPVVKLGGVLGKSSTLPAEPAAWALGWVNGGREELEVPEGKTLTVAPGAVFKSEQGGLCAYNVGCALSVHGTLNAIGTAAQPITFTSINDNSIGGTTGSGSPHAGDWRGIATLGEHGSIDLEHASLSYAQTAVQAYAYGEGSAVVKNNTFSSQSSGAAWINGAASPALQGNSSTDSGEGQPAFMVSSSSLDADLLGANSATGNGIPVVKLGGVLGKSSTLPAEPAAWALGWVNGGREELEVPEGKTLTVAPGAVFKSEQGGLCAYNVGCALSVHGTLNAIGTAAQPITFTSINDNSIGGTTGSGSPHAGDWRGIATLGEHGSIDLEHASLSYAQTAVQAYAYGEGSAVVKNNTFSSQSSGAAWINGAASPALQGNSSTDSGEGQPAFMVSSSSLDADLLGANSATGNGIPVVKLGGVLGKSSTLPAEPAAWALGWVNGGREELEVPEGKTLTVAPGAVFKSEQGGLCAYNVGCALSVHGTLNAIGTAAQPITFTSINDNSIGGTTGSGSPHAGDWRGIATLGEHGSIDLEHASLSYAQTAVQAYGQGHNAVRGTLNHNLSDIQACSWNSESCTVDAAYVDWGMAGGPTSPELVCGAVTISPYLYEGTAHEDGSGSENCDGSPTPWDELHSGQEAFNAGVANAESLCAELEEDVCEVINSAFNCLSAAFDLGASQLPFALPNPFSGGVSGSDWKSAATTVGSTGAKWLSDSADPVVADIGKVASRGFQILGVAGTFISLANAYNQCAP